MKRILVGVVALTLTSCSVGFGPKTESFIDKIRALNEQFELEETAAGTGIQGARRFVPKDPLLYTPRGAWVRGTWQNKYENQWYLRDMKVDKAWKITRGAGIKIALMDSGVDGTHPDLAANIQWDTGSHGTSQFGPEYDTDTHGFGTANAGIIGAVQDNGIGISGIAPEAKLIPYRITMVDDAEALELIRGLDVANRIIAEDEAHVVSLPGGLWNSPGLAPFFCDIGEQAADKGIIIVTTAHNGRNNQCSNNRGNNGAPCEPIDIMGPSGVTPANCPFVIAVSAYALGGRKSGVPNGDKPNKRASHSNFGNTIENGRITAGVLVAAPGGDGAINDPGPDDWGPKKIKYGNNNILTLLAADPTGAEDYLKPVRDGLLGHYWKRYVQRPNPQGNMVWKWEDVREKTDITDAVRIESDLIGENDGEYVRWRGSLSTAMVAGTVALMLAANDNLRDLETAPDDDKYETLEAVKFLLEISSVGARGGNPDLGAGRVNAQRAVKLAEAGY